MPALGSLPGACYSLEAKFQWLFPLSECAFEFDVLRSIASGEVAARDLHTLSAVSCCIDDKDDDGDNDNSFNKIFELLRSHALSILCHHGEDNLYLDGLLLLINHCRILLFPSKKKQFSLLYKQQSEIPLLPLLLESHEQQMKSMCATKQCYNDGNLFDNNQNNNDSNNNNNNNNNYENAKEDDCSNKRDPNSSDHFEHHSTATTENTHNNQSTNHNNNKKRSIKPLSVLSQSSII